MPETLRGINKDDWDNMDWADGIKPGQSVLVNGESGLNRVWNAPDLGIRPVMTGRPKGVYSKDSFGGKAGSQDAVDEKKEDGSGKKGKNKKKGWRYGKMSLNFETEKVDVQQNGTEAGDLGEDFGVGRADRNETVGDCLLYTSPSPRD